MEDQTQPTISREDLIANLNQAIEIQELQTKLQELRTRLINGRVNEVKLIQMFEDMTKPIADPTTEEKEAFEAAKNNK